MKNKAFFFFFYKLQVRLFLLVSSFAHVSITVDQGSAQQASGPNLAHLFL